MRFTTGAAGVDRIEAIGGGLINDTFRVVAGAYGFILQRLNPAVFADADAVMANILTVTDHVGDGILPHLRPTRTGEWTVTVDGATWRAWEQVVGAETIDVLNVAQARSAARLVARLHDALEGLDPAGLVTTIAHFHDPAWHLDRFTRICADDPLGRAGDARAEIDAIQRQSDLARLATELNRAHGPAVAHNDTKPSNFLFRGDDAVALVDLDTLMPTAWFWDVADLVRGTAAPGPDDASDPAAHRARPELVEAVVDAYREIRPVGDELEAGCVVIAYEQAVRFLADWLEGDRHWKTTSPTQNLDRARGQLVLVESLRGVESLRAVVARRGIVGP